MTTTTAPAVPGTQLISVIADAYGVDIYEAAELLADAYQAIAARLDGPSQTPNQLRDATFTEAEADSFLWQVNRFADRAIAVCGRHDTVDISASEEGKWLVQRAGVDEAGHSTATHNARTLDEARFLATWLLSEVEGNEPPMPLPFPTRDNLPPHLATAFELACDRTGLSPSEAVATALAQWMNNSVGQRSTPAVRVDKIVSDVVWIYQLPINSALHCVHDALRNTAQRQGTQIEQLYASRARLTAQAANAVAWQLDDALGHRRRRTILGETGTYARIERAWPTTWTVTVYAEGQPGGQPVVNQARNVATIADATRDATLLLRALDALRHEAAAIGADPRRLDGQPRANHNAPTIIDPRSATEQD